MLRKRYGEQWTILLQISQGSKKDTPKVYTLKCYWKDTIHLFIFYYHVFPLSKVVAHCLSGQRCWCDRVWGKLWLYPSCRHCEYLHKLFPCMLQSKKYMWCTFMRAPLIVSFSGSLQWRTCFPDAALSSIQVIKKVYNAASASLNKPPVHWLIVPCCI